MKILYPFLLFTSLLSLGWGMAEEKALHLYDIGKLVQITKTDKGISSTPVVDIGGVWPVLNRISISPLDRSSSTYVIAGKVVSDNTGIGLNKVLVQIGERAEEPEKVCLTQADGTFRFQLHVDQKNSASPLKVKSLSDSYLYIGGTELVLMKKEGQTAERASVSIVRRYPLSALQTHARKHQTSTD